MGAPRDGSPRGFFASMPAHMQREPFRDVKLIASQTGRWAEPTCGNETTLRASSAGGLSVPGKCRLEILLPPQAPRLGADRHPAIHAPFPLFQR
jgi:hypothetical protein